MLRPIVILLLWAVCLPAMALAAASRESLPTAEERLLAELSDGVMSDRQLLGASLIASGVDEVQVAAALARYDNWLAQIDRETLPIKRREAAAAVFDHMHGVLLCGQYHATCSDVATALERGDFNCLSATILYVCAARHFGLEAAALATDGHVLCQIAGEDGPFEVETTCPSWFRLTAADADAAKERRLTPRRDDNAKQREIRQLSDAELLAKVYYNRGVSALRDNQYELGLRLTRTSLQLDPHDAVARGNVLAGLNNWALALCRQGEHARAAVLLAELRKIDPAYPTLAENEAHLERAQSASGAP